MGKDKFENEDLIKYGWENDVWFHVDNLSSAHVYLRLEDCKLAPGVTEPPKSASSSPVQTRKKGSTLPPQATSSPSDNRVYCNSWENIPNALLQDLAQLCKANSIDGNKKDNITVIYTPHSNLKKRPGMETGQTSFYNDKLVKKVFLKTRQNDIVNRLNKTKVERLPDLALEKVEHDRLKRSQQRALEAQQREEEEERIAEARKEKALRSYDILFDNVEMTSNHGNNGVDEDDFM